MKSVMDRPVETTRVMERAGQKSHIRNNSFYLVCKRLFDIVASAMGILVLSPVFLIISIAVIIDDGFPVFYCHKRIGLNGKQIGIYKFRSMRKNADNLEKMLTPEQLEQYRREFKIDNDPRITPVGDFLRKTSIDELPQLLNILKGELSVIGPRPLVEEETYLYGEDRDLLLSAKPGLTGYWQAYARNNATYASGKRQEMELYYIRNRGCWLDFKILCRTVVSVLMRDGAS